MGDFWRYLGMRVQACDGTPDILRLSGGRVEQCDAAASTPPFPQADWTVSLEVGEHIPKEAEGAFIDTVARSGRNVVLSWAVPEGWINPYHFGWVNPHHVNEKPNHEVMLMMHNRGFRLDRRSTQYLRANAGHLCCP